jgi:hypothetical protein
MEDAMFWNVARTGRNDKFIQKSECLKGKDDLGDLGILSKEILR